MPRINLDAALRLARNAPRETLSRRPDADLPFVEDDEETGQALLLDTCVYIDQTKARAPDGIRSLIRTRLTNHSTVAIQELLHALGALDPTDPRTSDVTADVKGVLREMPHYRIFTPDADVSCRAAVVAGVLCRLQGYSKDHKLKALNDCTLFLQAQKLGLTLLTANIVDFDFILQLLPAGRVLFYRSLGTSGQA